MLKFRTTDHEKTNNSLNRCEFSYYQNYINHVKTLYSKFISGDPPPPTHYSMIALVIFTLICVITTLLIYVMSFFHFNKFESKIPNFVTLICFIILFPSLYEFYLFICCWKRVEGYDWWMIPILNF